MGPMSWRTKTAIAAAALVAAPIIALRLLGLADGRSLWLLLLFIPVGALIAFAFTTPLHELTLIARRLQKGELTARSEISFPAPWDGVADTMGELAEHLDLVSKNLERQVSERTAELNRKAVQLRALGQVGQQVAAVLEPGELLHFVVRLVRGTFGYDVVAVVQQREGHLIVSACAARGVSEPPVGRLFHPDDDTMRPVARLLQHEADATDSGWTEHPPSPLIDELRPRAELLMPIRVGERTLGVMVVQRMIAEPFDDDDVFTVKTIAGQVAVALENARLFDAERRLRELAITEERNRMSREIHDTLAQGFMGILMHLRALHRIGDVKEAAEHRHAAESLAQQSLDEARRSVWNLRPARLHGQTLTEALQDELKRLEGQTGAETTLDVPANRSTIDTLPVDHATALLRITQEALHNVAKHARATNVSVSLHLDGRAVLLRIEDDGLGFDAADVAPYNTAAAANHAAPHAPATADARREAPRSFGMLGMQERAHQLGGTAIFDSAPGDGTKVRVRLPLP